MKWLNNINSKKIVEKLSRGASGEIYVIKHNNKSYTVKNFEHPKNIINEEFKILQKLNHHYPSSNFPIPIEIIHRENRSKYKSIKNPNCIIYEYIKAHNSRLLIHFFQNINYYTDFVQTSDVNSILYQFQNKSNKILIDLCIKSIKKYIYGIAELIKKCNNIDIAHLDIKPENILIQTSDNFLNLYNNPIMIVKDPSEHYFDIEKLFLIDFGFAKNVYHHDLHKLNNRFGTLKYISPEIMYHKEFSIKSDIYSLGIIFDEIIIELGRLFHKTEKKQELDDIKKLIKYMKIENPSKRISVDHILELDWLNT